MWKQYRRIVCAKDIAERVFNDRMLMEVCGCYPPCNEIVYDIACSMSKLPAEGDRGERVLDEILNKDAFLERFNDSVDERELYA